MKPLRASTILKQKLSWLFCGVALLLAQAGSAQTVAYTATPTTGSAPLQVIFTSPSIDSVGNAITSWNWSFGDGGTSTNQNPTNIYESIGIFTPVLTVTNSLEAAILASGPTVDVIPATGVITWTNTNGGLWNVATNWSPNQVPSSTNTVLITNAGTYTVILNIITNVANLIIGTGSTNNGVQTLQTSEPVFGATNALINTGGILNLTNTTITGVFNVAGGAIFSANEATVAAQVTVANGGKMLFLGTASQIGANGDTNNPNDWLLLQNGAQFYANSQLFVFAPITNSGTCYLTNIGFNGGFVFQNTGISEDDGGLVNLTNGVIDLIGGSVITGTGSGCYVTNQGTINAITGVNSVNVGFALLTGTYNAAAGATMGFGASTSPGTSPGAGLTLNGAGRFEFGVGLLTLPSNTIPNMQMMFGTLELGPDFQGGAITNLTLDGINFSNINTLPVTGTLIVSNDSELSGPFLVTGGAVLNIQSAIIYAQVTVASGGELQLTGGAILGDAGFRAIRIAGCCCRAARSLLRLPAVN